MKSFIFPILFTLIVISALVFLVIAQSNLTKEARKQARDFAQLCINKNINIEELESYPCIFFDKTTIKNAYLEVYYNQKSMTPVEQIKPPKARTK